MSNFLRRHASEGWHPCPCAVSPLTAESDMGPSLRWGDGWSVRGGWVYIMTNKPFGTLYIGVTSDLAARVWQHRTGQGSEFCKRHGLHMLVYAEQHDRIDDAIAREKAIKAWKRNWKLRLIMDLNPDWRDLFEDLNR